MAMTTANQGSLTDQIKSARQEFMSMGGEVGQIASEMQRLFQMELELAQAEMQEARGHAVKGSAFGAIAALVGIITTVFLFLAIMFGLDTVMPLWGAALATTGIAALLAAIFGFLAKKQFSAFSPVPSRAIKTMQEDISWARSQIKSNMT